MDRTESQADLIIWRPAAVLVVDLVKHSTRSRSEIRRIQKLFEDIFCSAFTSLGIKSFLTNYTGDGYVCAFLGDCSARVIDFINGAVPELQRRLSTRDQEFRAGLDFGLLQLRFNELTNSYEHFDEVGINAARLEQEAKPNQLLCTDTFYNIFFRQYPEVFPFEPITVKTKDRDLLAYELQPYDYLEIQRSLTNLIYGRSSTLVSAGAGRAYRILIVDDERQLAEGLAELFRISYPQSTVIVATSAEEALSVASDREFDLVLTDLMMPGVSGIELTEHLLARDPTAVIIMMTGHASIQTAIDFYEAGGFHYLFKPFRFKDFSLIADMAFGTVFPSLLRKIAVLCDAPGRVIFNIQRASQTIRGIITSTARENDIGQSLIRHKAKQIVSDFVKTVRPGTDLQTHTELLLTQTQILVHLANLTHHVTRGQLFQFLDQYASDLMKRFDKLKMDLRLEGISSGLNEAMPETVLVLITCELIDNAVAALSGEGNIQVEVSYLNSTRQLRITVNDNGEGIAPETLPRIFESGFSTKGAGRGLGLHLVQEAAQRLNGEVIYRHHNGACFSVLLALEPSQLGT